MVTFICDQCQVSLKKNKVDSHCNRCMSPSVSCVDCGVAFFGNDYAGHTSCVTEKEKYEGKLYKGKKTVPVGVPTYSRSSEKRTKSDKKEKHSKRKLQEAHEETSESKKYKKANREGQDSKPDSSSSKPVTSTLLISSCLEKKSDGISLETLLKKVNKKLTKKNEKILEQKDLFQALVEIGCFVRLPPSQEKLT